MIHHKNILYLGSKSPSRQRLLQETKIPFVLVEQDADEAACEWGSTLHSVVEAIAVHKMEHVVLTDGQEGEVRFVLTADTMSQDHRGQFSGKPVDRDDAIAKIKIARHGMKTGTAFCLDKKIWKNGAWLVEKRHVEYIEAHSSFIIPDEWIERYFQNSIGPFCAGAIAVEEYGALFLKDVQGSYSTIVGLPMFEVREALTVFGFFE